MDILYLSNSWQFCWFVKHYVGYHLWTFMLHISACCDYSFSYHCSDLYDSFQWIRMRLYVSFMLAILLCLYNYITNTFLSGTTLYCSCKHTYFDQKLIIFMCFNTKVFKNKVCSFIRSCRTWSKHQRVTRSLDLSVKLPILDKKNGDNENID